MATFHEVATYRCAFCGKGGWVFEFTKCHEECTTVYCDKCIQKYPEAAARVKALDEEVRRLEDETLAAVAAALQAKS